MHIRMLRKLLSLAIIVGTVLPMQAVAADYSESFPRSAATWQGFYLGALTGAESTNIHTQEFMPSANFDMNASAYQLGGFAGHNWQWWRLVAGVEVDTAISKADHQTLISGIQYAASTDWKYSMRGRLGVTFDSILLYTTAGVAATTVDMKRQLQSASQTETGIVLGVGADVRVFDMVFVRGEYVYTGMTKTNFNLNTTPVSAELTGHALRAGVGLKF